MVGFPEIMYCLNVSAIIPIVGTLIIMVGMLILGKYHPDGVHSHR